MPISSRIVLDQSDTQIKRIILEAMINKLNRIFRYFPFELSAILKRNIRLLFQQSSTYQALVNGDLRGHFGFPMGTEQDRVDAIVNEVANSTEIVFTPFSTTTGRSISGGLKIMMGSKELRRYTELGGSTVVYTSEFSGETVNLPWAEWLLERGGQVIIDEYIINFSPHIRDFSRSGIAIMQRKSGGVWRVPVEYWGTPKDNWITRTFIENTNVFLSVIANNIQQLIDRI